MRSTFNIYCRCIALALLVFTFCQPLLAQSSSSEKYELIHKVYYDRGSYIAAEEYREGLSGLIDTMRADSGYRVNIVGYCDKWGSKAVNDRLSYVRAMYIADWLRTHSVPKEQIFFKGRGVDTLATTDAEARRVEIQKVITARENTQSIEEGAVEAVEAVGAVEAVEAVGAVGAVGAVEPKVIAAKVDIERAEPRAEPSDERIPSNFALRTNLLYWTFGLMNVGVEYRLNEVPIGILLNCAYSPLGGREWKYTFGGWFVSPEVRYYLGGSEQWFVGAQFMVGGYDIKLSDTGRKGTHLSGGIMGGYKIELTEYFDMDFTLGVGYCSLKYDTYYHSDGVNVVKMRDITNSKVLPIQAGVNLIWKIK